MNILREPLRSCMVFANLASDVIQCHYHCMLLANRESLSKLNSETENLDLIF